MEYESFKEQFAEAVQQAFYEKGIDDVNIDIRRVDKMNESYDSITVTPEGSNVGVNMNINHFYEGIEAGVDFNEVVDKAVDTIQNGLDKRPTVDVEALMDYDNMKGKLAMEVVSTERNADILEKVPHQDIEDMSVVYRFVLGSEGGERASILVTNDLINQMGVTPDQLHADAMANSPEIRPAVIQGMTEVIAEMMGPEALMMFPTMQPEDEIMFVATVPDKISGAGVIAYQDFMDQAADKLGGDFYVLPSSIHEIILVKDEGNMSHQDLEAMVKEINANEVRPEEKLTDNVYHYDSKDHVFEIAGKFEDRMAAKEAEAKDSVLADLASKKQDVDKLAPTEPGKKAPTKGGQAL